MLSPTLEVLDNEEASEGINFMLNLIKYMEENSEQVYFELDKKRGVSLTSYRCCSK